jgi:hypothetical protein
MVQRVGHREVVQKYLESFEMWCWRRMEKTGCWEFITEHVQYINLGIRDSFTYVIFGIDIRCSCISSL